MTKSGKNIVFLFITDEKSSPINDYNRFTADLQGEKFRIPEDEYNYLRELLTSSLKKCSFYN